MTLEELKLERDKHICLFENKPCRHAKKENGCFECTAPTDDSMPCKK